MLNVVPTVREGAMICLGHLDPHVAWQVKSALTFENPAYAAALKDGRPVDGIPRHVHAWREGPGGLLVPRHWQSHHVPRLRLRCCIDGGGHQVRLQTRPREAGPDQRPVCAEIDRCTGDHGLELPCGFGKALANGEPILTPGGEKPIGEAQVGDLVAGTDGHFHEIVAVHPQGEREIFRVTFTDGTHVDCDGDHLWTLEQKDGPKITMKLVDLLDELLFGIAGQKFYLPEVAPIDRASVQRHPRLTRAIEGIEKIGVALATCITVASPDGLFLTRNCVPTHNSFLGLYSAARRPGRALVVAPTQVKFDEWVDEAAFHAGLPTAGIGRVQGKLLDWEDKPIVVAMMKTMAIRDFPEAFCRGFGTVMWDEAHTVSAPVMSRAFGKVDGVQVPLSATPGTGMRRRLIELHCGDHWIKARAEARPTTVHFFRIRTPPHLASKPWRIQTMLLARDPHYGDVAATLLRRLLATNRRVLVLSDKLDVLARLWFEELRLGQSRPGLVCGTNSIDRLVDVLPRLREGIEACPGSSNAKRLREYVKRAKQEANPILAIGLTTTQPGGMGMDVPDLDGGLVTFPVGKPDMTRQLLGRWRRDHPTKQDPLLAVMYPDTQAGIQRVQSMAAVMQREGVAVNFVPDML